MSQAADEGLFGFKESPSDRRGGRINTGISPKFSDDKRVFALICVQLCSLHAPAVVCDTSVLILSFNSCNKASEC